LNKLSAEIRKNLARRHESTKYVLLNTPAQVYPNQNSTSANIVFFDGAQRYLVTEDLARKVDLAATGAETFNISGFGDRQRRIRVSE